MDKDYSSNYDISVIIPTYNRSTLLEYTLQSLIKQHLNSEKFEVIVADDGSYDNTCDIIEAYRAQLNLKYLCQQDRGYRPSSARNMGIRAAQGRICVFIDAGIVLDRDCLEEHLNFHTQGGLDVAAIGYIFGLGQHEESVTKLQEMLMPDDPASLIERVAENAQFLDVREPHYHLHNDQIHLLRAPWFYFWSGHISVSKNNLFKIRLFDESYDGRWGIEDIDLGFRLHAIGVKIHLLRSAQSIHFPHHSHESEKINDGRLNCAFFDNKFKTLETGLFLKNFGCSEFWDINSIGDETTKA